jgi:ribosomal RNA-processing protein 8
MTTATNSSHSKHPNSPNKPNNLKKKVEIPQRKQVSVGKKVEEKDKRLVPFGKRQMSKLQLKMASKLSGSRFRWINETLYTAKSEESFQLFSKEPELFSIYHKGFASQVSHY